MREGESSREAGWLKALIISLSINLLKLLQLWDSYHQKIYCPFLCPYPVVSPPTLPHAVPLHCLKWPIKHEFSAAAASKESVTNSWHILKLVSIGQGFDLWNDCGKLSFKSPI